MFEPCQLARHRQALPATQTLHWPQQALLPSAQAVCVSLGTTAQHSVHVRQFAQEPHCTIIASLATVALQAALAWSRTTQLR